MDGQLGLERTPDEYIQTMVAVFRELRRVLRDDGTCWVNMGDSYNANQGSGFNANAGQPTASPRMNTGLSPKQLLMMPARLALALQADGWWIRSEIVWAKPNPMPESVTDRPTSAHEKIYLLTKRSSYFYDADAVREEQSEGTHERFGKNSAPSIGPKEVEPGFGIKNNTSFNAARPSMILPNGRNLRNVWSIPTHAYPDAHFATFPPELAERCIKAGTSERGCCAQCGTPWVRQVEREVLFLSGSGRAGNLPKGKGRPGDGQIREGHDIRMGNTSSVTTTGWSPGCQCTPRRSFLVAESEDRTPCTVLDPFAGAGTTGLVADRRQRDAIMIELNPAYCAMQRNRIVADAPLLAEVAD